MMLTTQSTALAEQQVSDGSSGCVDKEGKVHNYEYELWSNDPNTQYTLKVWQSKNYPKGFLEASLTFESGREALDYCPVW